MATKDGTRFSGSQIQDETVTSAQVKDGSIQAEDLAPGVGGGSWSPLAPHTVPSDGVLAVFTLPWSLSVAAVNTVRVTRNGLEILRAANPTTIDEWKVVGDQLTFGSAPAGTDTVIVSGWTD